MSRRPLILATNDDGIGAPGLAALANAMSGLGRVVVVAPHRERSAAGHGITIGQPLRMRRAPMDGVEAWSVNGTPVDCVRLALETALGGARPDLVVSGINLGSNTGINIIYSGTVSAAFEALHQGIPAVAVSVDAFEDGDFRAASRFAAKLAGRLLALRPRPRVLLNVNAPSLPPSRIRGVAFTRQGRLWHEQSFVRRTDPWGEPYFWPVLKSRPIREARDVDSEALKRRMISVTPIQYDVTDHSRLEELQRWGLAP